MTCSYIQLFIMFKTAYVLHIAPIHGFERGDIIIIFPSIVATMTENISSSCGGRYSPLQPALWRPSAQNISAPLRHLVHPYHPPKMHLIFFNRCWWEKCSIELIMDVLNLTLW